MTKTAFERDGILTPEERVASARKCLSILASATSDDLSWKDFDFVQIQRNRAKSLGYGLSERELAWLRDIVARFI